jgi:hypothetical protein
MLADGDGTFFIFMKENEDKLERVANFFFIRADT